MKSSFVLVVFYLAVCGATVDYRGECVKKFINMISSFFQTPQITGLADVAMGKLIEQAEAEDIIGAMIDQAVANLTSGQYSQFTQLMLSAMGQFGSYQAINATIKKCMNGLGPVVSELYPKLTKKIEAAPKPTYKSQSKVGFEFVFNKMNKDFLHNAVEQCKNQLTSSEWSKATSLLKSYVKFSQLGYSV